MTTAQMVMLLVAVGGGLWLLHWLGHGVTKLLEAAAAIAVLFVTLWLALKGMVRLVWWVGRHWRTTGATAAGLLWWRLLGWPSLLVTAAALGTALAVWWLLAPGSFEPLVGRRVRAWWSRWFVYGLRMPRWLRACGLTVSDPGQPVTVALTPFRRTGVQPRIRPRRDQVPRLLDVRSGPSWDECHVRLVAGLTPEHFDEAARKLAVARGVSRCQVRELAPDVVSIDFQRQDRLAQPVACPELASLATVRGEDVDLYRVWSGRTEYGTDWHQSLRGGHTLHAGATGAGKGSFMWQPIASIAPAIRDGLVRVSGIDPKGMELAYGRGIFHRYAVTSADALELLDALIDSLEARKREFAGRLRDMPITREHPLELLEFDEVGALLRYVGDRKTREALIDRVAVLNTQGRALGFTVRGYVQEPTKDTVPVRDLFPRRVCLRVATKSHVGMVLGDQAWDRGAWANRIGESEAGVGYLFGEGVREPLRVRAGWVPDETIKALEEFVIGAAPAAEAEPAKVLTLPRPSPPADDARGALEREPS